MQVITRQDIPEDVKRAKQRLGIVGSAPRLIEAISRAIRVAPIDLSVLVTGESGTGKEFFPQIIHNYSPRKHNKYIAVNCGAIPEGTIDSELFGHEKGAFTGAIASRKGYFEEADGGTIFLDEVAELPPVTQARLLRVLESGEFLKVGSSVVQKTNIRVVAATNVDLLKAVEAGKFREDLYYRLSTVQISIPPLRSRGSDIMLLARKFAADFAERYRMPPVEFSHSGAAAIDHFLWPGNVRQLKNVVEQIALFEAGREVDEAVVASYLPEVSAVYTPVKAADADPGAASAYMREREMLFNMIFRLQNEIENLKATMDAGRREVVDVASTAHGESGTPCSLVKVNDVAQPIIIEPADHRTLSDTEKDTIRMSLERHGGKRKAAAKELNISERTLYRKIKEYGLE